jgi:peroxiredoxin
VRRAAGFSLLNEHNELVKFDRYRQRHKIIVVFFDGAAVGQALARAADGELLLSTEERQIRVARACAPLLELREHADELKKANTVVVAVSAALPQQMRAVEDLVGDFPFDVLSDPAFEAHRAWKRFDANTQAGRPGVFVVDMAGDVPHSQEGPRPETSVAAAVKKALSDAL